MNNSFTGKKILIFGLGLNEGGVGTANFFSGQNAEIKVTDLKKKEVLKSSLELLKKQKDITYTLGEHKYEDIDWADLIIKNPAVKPGNPFIEYALRKGKKVETDMGIFLGYAKPSQIIGITGTKGKSTTSSLIYEVLKAADKDVMLAGNIGKSVLDKISLIKKDTLVVLELSSFQLEAFEIHRTSPKWAVITNIYPDHLNYYPNMDQYIQAKKIITKFQNVTDYLFLRKGDPVTSDKLFLKNIKSQIHYFSPTDLPHDFYPNLCGKHNLYNIAAAFKVTSLLDVKKQTSLKALKNFKGLPFRMELIKECNGIKIYNDTAATSPDAGIQAIKTFPNCILICGGMNKGMDYTEYAKFVSKDVKKIYFLEGDSTKEIQRLLSNTAQSYNNLVKLLTDVKKESNPGDIILFSPAATSFNLFQNEFDRGRKFNEAVKKVFG